MLARPRPYQDLIRDFGLDIAFANRGRCRFNCFASPGTGKTMSSYLLFDQLRTLGLARRALILAPKRVALTTWPGERQKWQDTFGHLTVAAAVGTPQQRLAALHANTDLLAINYDNIHWLMEQVGDRWPFDTVFADESSRLKGARVTVQTSKNGKNFINGQGSKRAKALADAAFKHVTNWVNLTGSPAANGLQDVWGQMWFIDAGQRLGRSFTDFKHRYFRESYNGHGLEPQPWAEKQIHALMRDVSITIDAKDWFSIKDPIEHTIYVDLPPTARKHYLEMEKELFTELEAGQEVEVFNPAAKCNKLLQIGSGAVYYEDGRWEPLHDEKLDALASLVEELAGEPLLVAYQFKPERDRILKAFPQAVYLDDKPETVHRFQRGEIQMLVCHPASAGHGLDLQHSCTHMVDFSSGWSLELDEQVIERVGPTRQAQIGKNCAVFRHRIIARDTVEEHAVLPRLKSKASVQNSLKDAMNRRRSC